MRRRALGAWLIAYGLAGLVLLTITAAWGSDLAARAERLASSADGALRAAIGSADAAADAFANVDSSLRRSQASAEAAAQLSRDTAATLDGLARAMELSILGAQPLLPLADDFAAGANQAARLADELSAIGSSLGASRRDLNRVAGELRSLADELTELRAAAPAAESEPSPIRMLTVLLLAWLAVPAIGALLAGAGLLRPTS